MGGDLCNQDINECETVNNGGCVYGTCINNVGSFLCACKTGWKGTFCDENVNECEINNGRCVNGVCNDTRGSFECKCRAGWQGTLCDQDIDECKTAKKKPRNSAAKKQAKFSTDKTKPRF